MTAERRRYKRYALTGQAVFRTADAVEGAGESVDVALMGFLLRSEAVPREGTDLWVRFTLPGRPEGFMAQARVMHQHQDSFGVTFIEEPVGLASLLEALESNPSIQGK